MTLLAGVPVPASTPRAVPDSPALEQGSYTSVAIPHDLVPHPQTGIFYMVPVDPASEDLCEACQ